jgi:protocatechuate 3,4-dioxygenase, beta subunit
MRCATPTVGLERSPIRLSRRHVLGGLGAASGLLVPGAACSQVEPLTRRGTPQLTMGPFYPLDRPIEEDADLTRVAGGSGRAQGTLMELSGRVLSETGQPVPRALIDVWQTNGLGRYHHPSDASGQPYDPNFQGAAVLRTGDDGRYWLRTVIPTPYERRQRHIHFDVRGKRRRLITQMFFPGEPNERDSLYPALRSAALQAAVTARARGEREGARLFDWDIVLAGE